MSGQYSISTPDLVQIGLRELGKTIPFVGTIISTGESVFGSIEMGRVKSLLAEIERRVGSLENAINSQSRALIVIQGCDQARGDILFDQKLGEYAGVIGFLAVNDVEGNQVVEVLDSLRRLSVDDLGVLHQFKIKGQFFPNRQVGELAGCGNLARISDDIAVLKQKMAKVFPTLMRLQGIGVLFLADSARAGMVPPNIGGLAVYMNQFAHLTENGQRLVQALPQVG